MIKIVRLDNGSEIEAGLVGDPQGKTIMLPVAKKTVTGEAAENLKLWGVDPELGQRLVHGLADRFQVLYFDYEGHLFANPNAEGLTAEQIVKDLLHIADEMKVQRFSYYGYSWLALAGLQLALLTDRLDSLVMGGFPPYEGPYKEMRIVTQKTYELTLLDHQEPVYPSSESWNPDEVDWDNVPVTIDPLVTKQFMTLYQSLIGFDDRSIQDRLPIPKLVFAGEQDTIVYGEKFGSVKVDIIGLLEKNKQQLINMGWDIEFLKGRDMDHTKAMQPAAVLPLIKPWFIAKLLGENQREYRY